MSGHTPGPWFTATSGDYTYVIGHPDWNCRRNGVEGEWEVCRLDDLCDQPAEVKANARLIAAAPELLAVLVAIHGQLVDQSINFGPLIADAEKAIAKAKGQP